MMAGKSGTSNPLVLTGNAPDASLSVQLHPLVLLTISDYITRHTLREQTQPIVGAILGQQNGRNYTLEFAYECKTTMNENNVQVDADWFSQRLESYREVHKAPALDLVGLFVMGPPEGPQPAHIPVLQQVQKITAMDGVLLLLFHGQAVDQLQGGKLPISLYEAVTEHEGEQSHAKFRELTFEVDSGDAEMIGVDFVAKGGGNATAVAKSATASGGSAAPSADTVKEKKGKGKHKSRDTDQDTDEVNGDASALLSPEDEELIGSLTAKANAVRMLDERLGFIREYLSSLPTSYLTDQSSSELPSETTNHTLLRSIQSMLSRLPLIAPPNALLSTNEPTYPQTTSPLTAIEREKQDVHMTTLLASLTQSVVEAQGLASKYNVLQRERTNRERMPFGRGPGHRPGHPGDSDAGALFGEAKSGY